MAIAIVDLSARKVGSARLLWNSLTLTRGAKAVAAFIAGASSGRKEITITVEPQCLFINHESANEIFNCFVPSSQHYARCLYAAGVKEINISESITAAKIKTILDTLSDKSLANIDKIRKTVQMVGPTTPDGKIIRPHTHETLLMAGIRNTPPFCVEALENLGEDKNILVRAAAAIKLGRLPELAAELNNIADRGWKPKFSERHLEAFVKTFWLQEKGICRV